MHTIPYMIRFSANCIFLSNEDLPIPMDQSDERLSVIETKSKTLKTVAKEMGYDIHSFIELLEKERDAFLVHLKMCKYSKQLAMTTIVNKTKKAIQEATSTTQSVLKTAIKNQDIDTIDEILEEAIQDIKNDTLIKSEIVVAPDSKKQIPFDYTNIEMKDMFMNEFKAGLISNTSLKWFSKITVMQLVTDSDIKFGNFWNLILNQATLIKLKWTESRHIDGRMQDIKIEHKERFRAINQHEQIDTFYFDKSEFMFVSKKTAIKEDIPF